MKVVFCFSFLEFFLLVTHVYSSAQENEDGSKVSTSFSNTGSTDNAILETTEIPPIVTATDSCSSQEPPVISSSTNTSATMDHPEISWELTANFNSCHEYSVLYITCTNIRNKSDVITIGNNFTLKTHSFQLLELKEQAIYTCYGKLKTGTVESNPSESIIISTMKTDNKESSDKRKSEMKPLLQSITDRAKHSDHFEIDGRMSETTPLGFTDTFSTSSSLLVDTTISFENRQQQADVTVITPKLCTLEPPVVIAHTNSSITTTHPTISWKLIVDRENCEENIIFSVKCTNIKNGTDVETIDKNIADDANEREVTSELASLKEQAMYRCYGILKTSTSIKSNPSDSIDVSNTITGKITIVKLIPTARSIFIEWDALPSKTKLNYLVNITELKAGHFSPDCGNLNDTSISTLTERTVYNHTGASPDYNYAIVISTNIRNNPISSDVETITTSAAAPEEPRNVYVRNSTTDDDSSNVSKMLSWDMPCYPHGRIQRFDIKLNGVYTPDHSYKYSMRLNYTLTASDQGTFVQTLEGLTASTNYTLNIKAVGVIPGLGYETWFMTRDARPSFPKVYASQSSSYVIYIHWELPSDVLYGNITNYSLNIRPLKPAHGKYPSDCPAHDPLYRSLDGAITSFNYTHAHGDWIYDIFVSASTSLGTGPNGTFQAITNTSAPEMPRNLDLSIPEVDDTSAKVKKLISWDVPCYPNGRIYSYQVNISGYYTVDGSHNYASTPGFPVSTDQQHYNVTLDKLNASTKYMLNITAIGDSGEGMVANGTFTTKETVPSAPKVYIASQSSSYLDIRWKLSDNLFGKITAYNLSILPLKPAYGQYPSSCPDQVPSFRQFDGATTSFIYSDALGYWIYDIFVSASTSKGPGPNGILRVTTNTSVPEKVRILNITQTNVTQEYDVSAIIKFERPCFPNGNLTNIILKYTGRRTAFRDIFNEEVINFLDKTNLEYKIGLKPEYSYQGSITAENDRFNNTNEFSITAPSGVPLMVTQHPVEISGVGLTGAEVTLRKEQFNNSNGDIKYISLILSEISKNGGDQFGPWNGESWPVVFSETEYQLTEDFWNPFKVDDVVTFSIGSDSQGCRKSLKYCNEPLKEDKDYFLIVRMLNKGFYKNSPAILFKTRKSWTGFILGLIFGLLIAGVSAIITYIIWKKGLFQIIMVRIRSKTQPRPEITTRIPCRKFLQYCKNMECNPQKYHEQYTLLTEKAKEVTADKTISIATLPENRRKNRYTNIAPYDETRVELRIDEDDEIGSDYINASFIKGYSGYIEYIATQGPMVTTTRDFWKMVLQENVTLIVMVSQFVENDKQKCHRYFPKNHESMTISDDMEVRCSTELHFGTYCVRNLQIRKDDLQATVTHMQFLDWPDFGVPNGTDPVLQFCYQLRERIRVDGGLIIVHCSAGVGRTGTLIATDILLQTANAGKHIDVYNTVLELRKQRVMMVQTDKQYVFIHSMLKDHLDRPPSPDLVENSEPVYENMEIIQDSRNSVNDMINNEDESKF